MSLPRPVASFLLACVFSFVLGCGGTAAESRGPGEESPPASEPSTVEAQSVCTARCWGNPSVSCAGSTCQAVDYQYVTCDGRRTDCPPPPQPCSASLFCESTGSTLSCSGYSCQTLDAPNNKVCGGVSCDGVVQYCPAFTDARECY